MSEGKRIKELRKKLNLKQPAFAAKIYRVKSTISQIENDKSEITPSLRQTICHTFNVREDWLLTGEGDMFNYKTYEQISGSEKEDVIIKDGSGDYPVGEQNKISYAVKMCIDVMESGTSYADALYHNLVHFDRAVKSEKLHNECKEDLEVVNKTVSEMRTRMDEMEESNKKLRDEIKKLQGLSGDSAPIALSVENAALTGTEDKET
jgi:transcriptional regulator with XRE-family HTH domain